MTRALALLAFLAAAPLAACVPELDDRAFLVAGPTLLAISSTPPEAAPSAQVTLAALYVDPSGELRADMAWSFCVDRQALTDQGTVAPECVTPGGGGLVPLGAGPSVTGALPMDACRLFGPDVPDPVMGQPAGRPVDPDPTGGYYQPSVLLVRDGADAYSIGATRIECGLSGADAQTAAAFQTRYRENAAPAVASLSLVRASGSTPIAPDAPGAAPGGTVARGEQVTLHATWATCPTTPVCGDAVCGVDETAASCPADCTHPAGCSGSEQYVLFDPDTRTLDVEREAIRIDWFATGGTLADDSTGRDATEADTPSTDDAWTVPATAGEVRLWLVVRDDRGGVGWASYRITVN